MIRRDSRALASAEPGCVRECESAAKAFSQTFSECALSLSSLSLSLLSLSLLSLRVRQKQSHKHSQNVRERNKQARELSGGLGKLKFHPNCIYFGNQIQFASRNSGGDQIHQLGNFDKPLWTGSRYFTANDRRVTLSHVHIKTHFLFFGIILLSF